MIIILVVIPIIIIFARELNYSYIRKLVLNTNRLITELYDSEPGKEGKEDNT